MADWQSLRDHVATSYPVGVDERDRFDNPDWDGLSVWVATSRGQRLVALLRRKDYNDDWYLQVSAPIATTRSPDPLGLREWNGRSPARPLLMAEGGLFYKRAYLLEWLDLPRIDTALNDVAGTSAGLETSLAQHGRN
jgi:hypothetical protein